MKKHIFIYLFIILGIGLLIFLLFLSRHKNTGNKENVNIPAINIPGITIPELSLPVLPTSGIKSGCCK